jgi:hypothetical protein
VRDPWDRPEGDPWDDELEPHPLADPHPLDAPPLLPVLSTRYVRGWPEHEDGRIQPTGLVDLLTREYATDAHFAAYSSPQPHRLTIEAAERVAVSMTVLVLDVDAPEHRADEAWRRDLTGRCEALPGEPFGYWTRNGARVIYRIEPRPVAGWSRWYVAQLLDLYLLTGILADPACRDWPHLYRVPHGTRDGEPQALGWVCGHPAHVGEYREAPASDGDRLRAAVQLARDHGGWRAAVADLLPPVQGATEAPRTRPIDQGPPSGDGALRHAVQRVREAGQGGRNRVLYAQAAWMAELVAKGEVDAAEARRALGDAAREVGLGMAEIRGVFRSAKLA